MRSWKRIAVIAAIPLFFGALVMASLPFLPSAGWSPDVRVSDGGMTLLIQFKAEPEPTVPGPALLMARVKDEVGYTSRVSGVHFTYSKSSRGIANSREGRPVGEFGTRGEGFYVAEVELPYSGNWQVDIRVEHGPAILDASFPLEVLPEG
jgi:hypothetical protein